MRAGVVRIVVEHLPRGPGGEIPVAGLARRARDRLEREERLGPRVRPRRRPLFARDALEHRPCLDRVAGAQQEFPLKRLQRIATRPPPSVPRISRSAVFPSSAASLNCPSASRASPASTCPVALTIGDRCAGQHGGGVERLPRAAAREQEHRPLALVEFLHHQRRRNGERLLQQRFGLPHLADVLIGRRQQIQIVLVVPIVLDRNLFRREVGRLERIRRAELRDRLVDPADAPEVVTAHVPRVRDLWRHLRIGRCRA